MQDRGNKQITSSSEKIRVNRVISNALSLSKRFLEQHIDINHPKFVIAQGDIQKLGTLQKSYLKEYINDWFGFSSKHAPQNVLHRLTQSYERQKKGFREQFDHSWHPKLFQIIKAEQYQIALEEETQKFNHLQQILLRGQFSLKYYEWKDQKDNLQSLQIAVQKQESEARQLATQLHEIESQLSQAEEDDETLKQLKAKENQLKSMQKVKVSLEQLMTQLKSKIQEETNSLTESQRIIQNKIALKETNTKKITDVEKLEANVKRAHFMQQQYINKLEEVLSHQTQPLQRMAMLQNQEATFCSSLSQITAELQFSHQKYTNLSGLLTQSTAEKQKLEARIRAQDQLIGDFNQSDYAVDADLVQRYESLKMACDRIQDTIQQKGFEMERIKQRLP